MAAATTPKLLPDPTEPLAQAVWAAMFEDDDLVQTYVDVALIHALLHLVKDLGLGAYPEQAKAKILDNLKEARATAKLQEHEFARRWSSYAEPPF